MNKTSIYIGIAAILLIFGAFFFVNTMKRASVQNAVATDTVKTETPATLAETTTAMESPQTINVKEFTVNGGNFTFTPNSLQVTKGDTVKITFKNDEGFHDWVLDEFQAKTKQLNAGEEETIQFVANTVGTFEFYCSVGKHRQMGMKGTLQVLEK